MQRNESLCIWEMVRGVIKGSMHQKSFKMHERMV